MVTPTTVCWAANVFSPLAGPCWLIKINEESLPLSPTHLILLPVSPYTFSMGNGPWCVTISGAIAIRISQTVRYRWKLIREQHQVEKGLLPVSPRRLVVVSSWQPLSLQCSKPTVEGTRQRLPHTNDRLGKLTFYLMVEICWALFASLPSLLKPWKGQFYQMMLTCTAVCVTVLHVWFVCILYNSCTAVCVWPWSSFNTMREHTILQWIHFLCD